MRSPNFKQLAVVLICSFLLTSLGVAGTPVWAAMVVGFGIGYVGHGLYSHYGQGASQ